MDYLIEFGEREDVRDLARAFLKLTDAVQGISVDLDDFWLASWQQYTRLGPAGFVALDRYVDSWLYGRPWHELGPMAAEPFIAYPFGIDTNWRPYLWSEYTARREIRDDPFLLRVILRPDVPPWSQNALAEIDPRGFQVRFEARPVAQLYVTGIDAIRPVVGGLSISSPSGAAGTLGGIVEIDRGHRFGLTCAHVLGLGEEAQQPSPRDDRGSAARIGSCVACSALTSHVPPLDPYDPSINEVDVAVVELDQPSELEVLNLGQVAAVSAKSHAHPNSSVEIVGKESGRRTLYIGGAVLTHEFDMLGTKYAYKNLFELKRHSRYYGVTGTFSRPVAPGDSGGWVFRPGTAGSEWLGVIVAGDGPVGYALPAEFACDWLSRTAGVDAVSVS